MEECSGALASALVPLLTKQYVGKSLCLSWSELILLHVKEMTGPDQ